MRQRRPVPALASTPGPIALTIIGLADAMAVAGVIVVCVLIVLAVLLMVVAFLAPGAQQRQGQQQQHQELFDVHGAGRKLEMSG